MSVCSMKVLLLDYVEGETSFIIVFNITGKVTPFWVVILSCLLRNDKRSVERTAFLFCLKMEAAGFFEK
jgi:hypothetical protein